MCRYGSGYYKAHYACFDCRKVFKRKLLRDANREQAARLGTAPGAARCPQCSALMADMGLDFAAPKMRDLSAWRHLESLYQSDITFHSCGCSGPGYIPRDDAQHLRVLYQRKKEYVCHMRFWSTYTQPATDNQRQREWDTNRWSLIRTPRSFFGGTKKKRTVDHVAAAQYWANNIKAVELRIGNLEASLRGY